jgi:hypothetical protein
MISKATGRQGRMNGRFIPDEEQLRDSFFVLEGPFGACDDDATPVVATHDIHCDSHKYA